MNVIVLHNIRSSENVGSIFRTSDAASIDMIYLTGYTPLPIDRFGRKSASIHKAALGAEEFVPWKHKEIFSLLKKLKKDNFQIIGVEQEKNSIHFNKIKFGSKNVFILGNEVFGLSKKILSKCDLIAEIPMLGKKESLNVSVALGIILHKFFK